MIKAVQEALPRAGLKALQVKHPKNEVRLPLPNIHVAAPKKS